MADLFSIIGLGIFIIGGIAFLIAAFRTSVIWGLGCILVAPVQIIYLFLHWDEAKKPFCIQLVGGAILFASAYTKGMLQF
jgi:uncharacterized membrane protein